MQKFHSYLTLFCPLLFGGTCVPERARSRSTLPPAPVSPSAPAWPTRANGERREQAAGLRPRRLHADADADAAAAGLGLVSGAQALTPVFVLCTVKKKISRHIKAPFGRASLH